MGLKLLDIDRCGRVSIKAYTSASPNGSITAHLDSSDNTILHEAGCSFLEVCNGDRDFQFGIHSIEGRNPPQSAQIVFDKQYASPPKVVVWFREFDFDQGRNWRLRASTEDITNTGFTLRLYTWADSKLNKASVTWIAHPANRPNIASGTFDTQEIRPWNQPRMENKKAIIFDKIFERPPRVLIGLNAFDIDCGSNLRLKALTTSITTESMVVHLNSWHDTTQYLSRADYIAIQDF
ncbi:h-type lectin domain-containing protein [Ceratobasidium sp. AG-Ba]|nr:h-type lectin domain-containing protein [Ceratobasidium sp. AG-Ba]